MATPRGLVALHIRVTHYRVWCSTVSASRYWERRRDSARSSGGVTMELQRHALLRMIPSLKHLIRMGRLQLPSFMASHLVRTSVGGHQLHQGFSKGSL